MNGTKKEFADHIGKSKAYVSKLVKQGRLIYSGDGKVDFEKSMKLIAATSDPSKIPEARMTIASSDVKNFDDSDVEDEDYADLAETDDDKLLALSGVSQRYQSSRADKESYIAQIRKVEYEKAIGELVHREGVTMASFKIGKILRDKLTALPNKLAPRVTVETNQKNNYAIIKTEIENIIRQIQNMLNEESMNDD